MREAVEERIVIFSSPVNTVIHSADARLLLDNGRSSLVPDPRGDAKGTKLTVVFGVSMKYLNLFLPSQLFPLTKNSKMSSTMSGHY